MLSITFTLTNREKTFTNADLGGAVKEFLKEYGEAVDEITKIHIWKVDDDSEYMIAKGKKTCATFIKGFQLKVVQQ